MSEDQKDCPVCYGTGRSNPLPPPRTGPGPCRYCDGTGKRPPKPDERQSS